ncbi:MAG: Fic family protein [Longimicrobiales bacterium]|nr:Fic family protein [Longimicrobiales bacterium]
MSDRERAIEWLGEHARERAPVFLPADIPEDVLQTLRRLDLVVNVAGGVLAVRSPGDEPARVIRALVWPIVETLARMYAPAVVERDSAVRLYLGRTDPGPEIRIRQTSQTRWREEIAPGVVIRVERGDVGGSRTLPVGEARVPVDTPECVLLSLPLQFLREGGLSDVALWMKSLVLSRPALTDAYRRQPRPVVLKRMEHIARDVDNERLADLLAAVLSEEQSVRIGRGRTGIGRELVIPPLITSSWTSHQPWLDRLQVLIRQSRADVAPVLAELELPAGPSGDLDALLDGAREAKAYDAYHSSSIEGYRLSLDEVSALLGSGRPGGPEIEDVRSRLAILGYGIAFDRLLRRIQDAQGDLRLTGNLALDLHVDLFSPSVEAGIVPAEDLREWRRNPVFIRDTLFVPPSPEKVGAMIDLVCDEISAIDRSEGLLRAILIHLWFVWIHPFPDGNGRVARFLMNTALLAGSLPWLTIRVDQRDAYFAALRRAQLDQDHAAFARFIARSYRDSFAG